MSELIDFLKARIAEDERAARHVQAELERTVAEEYAGAVDERGPFTTTRLLHAQLWALYDGQSRSRNFAKGQYLADMGDPARVLAECKAKRAIIEAHSAFPDPQRMAWGTITACSTCGSVDDSPEEWPCDTLRHIAAIYADHPDYRQEWGVVQG